MSIEENTRKANEAIKGIQEIAAKYTRGPVLESPCAVEVAEEAIEALKCLGGNCPRGTSYEATAFFSRDQADALSAALREMRDSLTVAQKEEAKQRSEREKAAPRTVERWIAEVTADETEAEKEDYGRDAYGSLLGWLAQLHEAGEDAAKVFRASVQAARRVIAFAGYRTRPECWDRLRDYEGQERNSAQRRVSHQARVALALRAGSGTEPQEAALVALGRYWLDVEATQAVKERASKEAQEVTRFVAWCKGLRVLYGPGTREEVRDLAALCLFRFGSLGSDGWAAELAVILLALHPQARAALDKVRPHGTPEIPARIGDKIRFVRVLVDGIDPLVSASDLDAHRPVLVALAYLYRYCNPLPA